MPPLKYSLNRRYVGFKLTDSFCPNNSTYQKNKLVTNTVFESKACLFITKVAHVWNIR
jgi:hypothetical protein